MSQAELFESSNLSNMTISVIGAVFTLIACITLAAIIMKPSFMMFHVRGILLSTLGISAGLLAFEILFSSMKTECEIFSFTWMQLKSILMGQELQNHSIQKMFGGILFLMTLKSLFLINTVPLLIPLQRSSSKMKQSNISFISDLSTNQIFKLLIGSSFVLSIAVFDVNLIHTYMNDNSFVL